MILHAFVMRPFNSHLDEARMKHASFSPDEARMERRGEGRGRIYLLLALVV